MIETEIAMPYTPADWYWRRSDGKLFSSARIAVVNANDPDFVAWSAPGRVPTPWPRDETGVEQVSELQDVLGKHGLFASLEAYAAGVRYEVEVAGVLVTVGGDQARVSTARENRDGMRDTMLRLLTRMRKDGDVLKIFSDGVPRQATNAEAEAAIAAASDHVQAAFNREEAVAGEIASGAIRTREQVDAAFAA